jgi:hypothetical protein
MTLTEPFKETIAGKRVRNPASFHAAAPVGHGQHRIWLLTMLAVMACLSISVGAYEGLHRSIDFQWSGAHLVAHHQDPWKVFLNHDPQHQILMSQIPNYLSELYIIFLPFGLMPFKIASLLWLMINVSLAVASARLAARIFQLDPFLSWIGTLVFLASTPLRVTFANGQHGLLILFCFIMTLYCTASLWRGLWLGVSYCKYSFTPVMVFSWILERRYKSLLVSLLPPLIGLLAVHFLVKSSLSDVLTGPLRSADLSFAFSSGYGDLMTIAQLLLPHFLANQTLVIKLPQLFALFGAGLVAVGISRSGIQEPLRTALVVLFTLILFKHLIYDFVMLLLPFTAVLAMPRSFGRNLSLGLILYFWYACSLVNRLVECPSPPFRFINLAGLLVIAMFLLRGSPSSATIL